MQFLTLSRRRTESFTDGQFAALLELEAARVEEMKSEGHVSHVWRRGDLAGACIVWNVETEAQVHTLLATLPFDQAGMLEILSMIPLTPYNGVNGKSNGAR